MIIHSAVCAYCGKHEATHFNHDAMTPNQAYTKPRHWKHYNNLDFCSHGCVAKYAQAAQEGVDQER